MEKIVKMLERVEGSLFIYLNLDHPGVLAELNAVKEMPFRDAMTELLGDSGYLAERWVVGNEELTSPLGDTYSMPASTVQYLLENQFISVFGEERAFEPVLFKREIQWYRYPLSYSARNTAQAEQMGKDAVEGRIALEELGCCDGGEPCDDGWDEEIGIYGGTPLPEIAFRDKMGRTADPFYYKDTSGQRAYVWQIVGDGLMFADAFDYSEDGWQGIFIAEPYTGKLEPDMKFSAQPRVGAIIEDSTLGKLVILFTFVDPLTTGKP